MSALKHASVSGFGLVALHAYTCLEELERGQLRWVLPNWNAGAAQLSLIAPSRNGQPQAEIALQDFLPVKFLAVLAALRESKLLGQVRDKKN